MKEPSKESLKQAIENLIEAGTTYNTDQLALIYHKSLKVFMVDLHGQSSLLDKNTVMAMFQSKRDKGEAPLNNWVEFSHLEVNGKGGHSIISRKVNLTGIEQRFVFSIELIWEADRWQVTREVAVAQAES